MSTWTFPSRAESAVRDEQHDLEHRGRDGERVTPLLLVRDPESAAAETDEDEQAERAQVGERKQREDRLDVAENDGRS